MKIKRFPYRISISLTQKQGEYIESHGRQIFPITEAFDEFNESCREAQGDGSRVRVANTLSSRYYKDGSENLIAEPLIIADRTRTYSGQGRNLESPKNITNTISGVQKDNLVLLDNFGGNIKQRVKDDGCAWTLGGSKTGVMDDKSIRRLTERECERLQGFPDDWTSGVSSTQRYKCLGNAVTVNVIQFLGEQILSSFDVKETKGVIQ